MKLTSVIRRQIAKDCPWFVDRMTDDVWFFGLKMIDGSTIGISSINSVKKYGRDLWAEVSLLEEKPLTDLVVFVAPTSRLTASINLSHVIAAFELADT